MKNLDYPPIWLFGFLTATWASRGLWTVHWPGMTAFGMMIVVAGVTLMVLAVLAMVKHKTTVIPHRTPDTLVSTSVFGLTRNPIYLGDAMVLTGLALWWGAPLGLLLVPAFVWLIQRRFIMGEESRLSAAFGQEFAVYKSTTRRWI